MNLSLAHPAHGAIVLSPFQRAYLRLEYRKQADITVVTPQHVAAVRRLLPPGGSAPPALPPPMGRV